MVISFAVLNIIIQYNAYVYTVNAKIKFFVFYVKLICMENNLYPFSINLHNLIGDFVKQLANR